MMTFAALTIILLAPSFEGSAHWSVPVVLLLVRASVSSRKWRAEAGPEGFDYARRGVLGLVLEGGHVSPGLHPGKSLDEVQT